MAEDRGVQSVERIFQIIEVLSRHPAGVNLQTVAQETGLAKSTAHRLLASLTHLGYAMQDSITAQYKMTLKMFEISSGVVNDMDIMSTAKLHLDRLAQRTGEAVHLVIRDGKDIVYIYKAVGSPVRMSSRMGLRAPLYCTGVGKAILATLPMYMVKDIWDESTIQKLTRNTVVDWNVFTEQLKQVNARGYAVDDEENELGIRCVAVAIPGPGGKAESAFSISGLVPYMTEKRQLEIAQMAMEARDDILRDMGLT